jgi:hypothetical protein
VGRAAASIAEAGRGGLKLQGCFKILSDFWEDEGAYYRRQPGIGEEYP